jgi:hypothetical protein
MRENQNERENKQRSAECLEKMNWNAVNERIITEKQMLESCRMRKKQYKSEEKTCKQTRKKQLSDQRRHERTV